MNRLVLQAAVLERKALRYTPAGLPALDLRLSHESQVEEAGSNRQVSMEVAAVGIGDVVRDLQALALGTPAVFVGFLAKQRNGRGIVFHVNQLGPVV
jgi:primosomal replication protein N